MASRDREKRKGKFTAIAELQSAAFRRRLADAEFAAATRDMKYYGPVPVPVADKSLSSTYPDGPVMRVNQFVRSE